MKSSNPPEAKNSSSFIQDLFNFEFKFKNTAMEASYNHFQKDAEKHLLKFYNFSVLFILTIYLISAIIRDLSITAVFSRILVLAVLVFCYSLSPKAPSIHKTIILFFNIAASYLLLKYMDRTGIQGNPKLAFLVGDFYNFIQMAFVLSFRNMYQRLLVYVMLTAVKCLASTDIFLSSPKYIILVFSAGLGVIYYFNDHMHDRKIFRFIYESRDKLKKFQQLLSNDFPLSVVITDLNLKSILYSNKIFKTSFTDKNKPTISQKENERANVDILKKLIIDPSSMSSSNSLTQLEKIPEISLFDFILKTAGEDLPTEENTVYTFKAHFPDAEGERFHYETKLSEIQWGGEGAFTIVLDDVSDKQTVIALKLADEQKDRVIATVSHELRTPINGILGLLEMTSARVGDSYALGYLENCKSCSKLLLYLVNSILNLSQLRNDKLVINKDYIDLTTYLEEIRSLYIFNCQQKNINFIIDKDPRIPSQIFTDQYKLTGVLINLLGNAVKFTVKGVVILGIHQDRSDSKRVIFSVKDTGIGIHESDRSKLFKMFGTLAQKSKSINVQGVGLGLTIASGLVEALGMDSRGIKERIEFESEPNKGSKFWFKIDVFPVEAHEKSSSKARSINTTHIINDSAYLQQEAYRLTNNPSVNFKQYHHTPKKALDTYEYMFQTPPPKSSNSNRNVLIVDDFPLNLMTAAYILEELGYKATKAFSGEEGLDLLKESQIRGKKFCMILTDIQMAVMDGLEMSQKITKMIYDRKMYQVPIVSLTEKIG